MWSAKLCLLLLVGTNTLAQQDTGSPDDQSSVCFVAKRYKNFRRFVYNYEAETFNGITGATNSKSGPKVSCSVEVEVPQTCRFILRTTDCSLSEIDRVDGEGKPVYRPSDGTEAFRAAMAKNPLKFAVEGRIDLQLYPEDDESTNILNIKRGIISALVVPEMDDDISKELPTVHGVCTSDLAGNLAETQLTITRDLSRCDGFVARRQHTNPLALISGMNYPLSKLISSTQNCNYKFDSQKKHMTSGFCKEQHIFLPFSHKNEYGISSIVSQTLTLMEITKINDRTFEYNESNLKHLPMDAVDDKSSEQTKDTVMVILEKLSNLPQTDEGEERAGLFHKLVSELRGLKSDVLTSITEEMMTISGFTTWQALVQCGTPECTSGILKILRGFSTDAYDVDAMVYGLGMLSNPSRLMVKDLLEMAQYKQSKPIMYALSNAARRLYKSEGVTPEITAVSEYMASILGTDCGGEKELTFLTLRVVGNMGDAMEEADPTIRSTLLKCMRQPATTLSVQLAAIQAFSRMMVTPEVRSDLQRVCQYPKGAVQKRLAAYLILMKDPSDSDFEMVEKLLSQEQNVQVKAFVSSHIYNILTSTDNETKKLGKRISQVLKDTYVTTHNKYTTRSRNYKLGMAHESLQTNILSNVIFDNTNHLPKEVMLEMTVKAFGYSMDVLKVGMEGKGFEPTIEALFGPNGFLLDTVSKTLYWADDKLPPVFRQLLSVVIAPKSASQTVPENLVGEIVRSFNKLVKDLQNQESPEAMAYLKIMGEELGFIKGSDLKFILENALLNARTFMHHAQLYKNQMPNFDTEMFLHYIFMDNKFTLPTASGLPMTFALSGTFAPGAKGGIHISPNMKELVFSPSVGVEFMTKMGIHMPEFVASAVEMRTNMFHESSLNAKISMEQGQVKLSIPAPQGSTKLFRIRNKVVIVGAAQAKFNPPRLTKSKCGQLFAGIEFCTKMTYPGSDKTNSPYFPLNGESMFAFDIKPTNEISEYTATISYDLLSEGKDGRQKVDSLKLILRAEGVHATEATATMKYNRNKNVFTTKVQVPDVDVEAGVKIGMSESSAKGKSFILEFSNKNVPQLSLIGRAKIQAMDDGMMQLQLLVPSLQTDATLSTTMSKADGLTMEIKSNVNLPEVSSVQAVTFKYGEEKAEVQLMSNVNADTKIPVHYTKAFEVWLRQFSEDIMEKQVVKTDMKLRHIFNKGIEAGNIWFERIFADAPHVKNVRDRIVLSMANIEMPAVPKNLFMNLESTFKYQFNQNSFMISIPLPLGGKSSEDLRIPPVVTSPLISVPQLGVELAPQKIQIPSFTIPSEYDLTLPLMGLLEVSAKVNSNYYDWEGMITTANNTLESPEYVAKFSVMAESPIKLLSFSAEGASKITDTEKETIEITLEGSLKHMLMNTGFNVMESLEVKENVLTTGRYNIYAAAEPLGLDTSLTITTQLTLDSDMLLGDLNTDGRLSIGSTVTDTTYLYTFSVEPGKKEAKMESTLRLNAGKMKLSNKIKASCENYGLLFESTTNMDCDPIKHTSKISLSYKDVKMNIQSDSVTKYDEKIVRSQLEFSIAEGLAALRIENQADYANNRALSLLTGRITTSEIEINADASMNIFSTMASHKATLSLNKNGLTTSCTTTTQHSPFKFENIFHAGVESSGASLSLKTKGDFQGNAAEVSVEGKLSSTEVYLNSMFESNMFDLNGKNRVNLRLSEDGLVFSNNMVGSFKEIRTENSHSLSLTLRSFTISSKTNNFLDRSNSYMHDIEVNMEHFTASATVKNDLKVLAVNFVNDAHFKAEPYTMELTGTMMGVFSNEELKSTYELKLDDTGLSTKCNTNGKLLGSYLTHTTDMVIAGLNMKINNVAKFDSSSLHLDNEIKAVVAPFSVNIDALFNSNGEVNIYGQQSGELYSKFVLQAAPNMFSHTFEYRASTSHEMTSGPIIKTKMNNHFNILLLQQMQITSLKMMSSVNDHTIKQEMKIFNNAERMGVEMEGAVSTTLFSEDSQDYEISEFVHYEKNTESYQNPFIEHLPALIDNLKTGMIKLMDISMETLKEFNNKYEISAKIQSKTAELKEAVDTFDFHLFLQDLKNFIMSLEKYVTAFTAQFPTDRVINHLKSIKGTIMAQIRKFNIQGKLNTILNKIEEFLSNYEVEKIISAIMDEVVKIMQTFQIREKMQDMFEAIKLINFQPLLNKVMVPVRELMNELNSFDFQQLIDDATDYFTRLMEKIKAFEFISVPEDLKLFVVEITKIPSFGKLHGEFKVNSPHYKFRATANLENTTTTSETPEFKINLHSWADSTLNVLDFTVDASAHLSTPEMSSLILSEDIKVQQSSFAFDHKGRMNFNGLSAKATADTTAKVDTELYVADLVNNAEFVLKEGISAKMDTEYKHDVKIPRLNIEMRINQKAIFGLQEQKILLSVKNEGNGKYGYMSYSDEATHKSDFDLEMDIRKAIITFTGITNSRDVNMNEKFDADISFLRHFIVNAKVETDTPFMKSSVAEFKFQAKADGMKIDLTASHDAELIGQVKGTLSSSALTLITPTELMLDIKNKGEAKVLFPFTQTGNIELQNDIAFTINSEVHQARWTGLARINQYKYSHLFSIDNDENEINMIYQINGEADLDVLKSPITIPEVTVPFTGMKTPRLENFSLWEDMSLGLLLITSKQTLDMNSKMKYIKNPGMITIDMDPFINSVNNNIEALHSSALIGKDTAAAILTSTYDKAKAEYEKYSIKLPKTIAVPAYRLPMMDVETSAFTIPLPDLTRVPIPSMHLPSALSKMTIPTIALPEFHTIKIPLVGDLTYEFSFKTAMMTLKSDASILTQDGFKIKLDASSYSEFQILNGNIEGSTSINVVEGFQLATVLSIEHSTLEGRHKSTIILSKDNVDSSITNSAKIILPSTTMEMNQEIKGNPSEGLVVSMSTPSFGLIGVQMQTKRPAQVKARLYGRYPTDPNTDVNILGVKISVVEQRKLNLKTTWSMEMPYEMMLGLKQQVPTVVEMMHEPATKTYSKILRHVKGIRSSFERLRKQGKAMMKRGLEKLVARGPSECMIAVTDKTIILLKDYQKRVERLLDAVITFLRQTKFQIPGYEQKLSGLEVYQKFSAFVVDFSEEAVEKIPGYFSAMFSTVLDEFSAIEFSLPDSNKIVSGKEILDELTVTLKQIQEQVIFTVRKLGEIQLETIIGKFSEFIQFTIEQTEKFINTLKSKNVDLSSFLTDLYNDSMRSQFLSNVENQVGEFHKIIMEYIRSVIDRLYSILDDISTDQLGTNIQSWINSAVKRINSFHNTVITNLKEKSKNIDQYVKVSDKAIEVDIPLPFAERN